MCKTGDSYIKQWTNLTKITEKTTNHLMQPLMDECTKSQELFCPVKSFIELYFSKLHPDLEFLWQRPKCEVDENDTCLYQKSPIAKNTIGRFMKKTVKYRWFIKTIHKPLHQNHRSNCP